MRKNYWKYRCDNFDAADILDKLTALKVTFNFVNPVLLELMSTDNAKEKLRRNMLLETYGFTQLPITETELKNASVIQKSLPVGIKCTPSAADFYIGGALLHYNHAYLLTCNVKDFPMPIFRREAFVPLVNQTDFKAISILSIDKSKLTH